MAPVWPTREALLLGIGTDAHAEKLVRATARMASQLDVPWHCVYVETPRLQRLPEAARKPACVLACPTSARLFGDIHDPDSEVSQAIRDHAGYALMPEWGTHPSNHYLPRRKTPVRIHADELARVDNPLRLDRQLPKPPKSDPSLDDVMSW